MLNAKDVAIVRELAAEVARIAALPVQEEKRKLWRKLNALKPARPMVMIDPGCWHELGADDELALRCVDKECQGYEQRFRRQLYKWRHCPGDMVVESFVSVPKAAFYSGFGLTVREKTLDSDPDNPVVSHAFENQLQSDDDLEKIRMPRIEHDPAETERRLAVAHDFFDGLLEVRLVGSVPFPGLWDQIAEWMGMENALYALVDRPDFIHRLLARMMRGHMGVLKQMEEQGLLCEPQEWVPFGMSSSGAYAEPTADYVPGKPRTKDLWTFGLAQPLAAVSPAMFKEFEVDYISPFCARFGKVYYGCCEPLDGKMAEVRLIPNVRKVSMSPWVDVERGAAAIGSDFVYSRKPNPAFLASDRFNPEQVREDLLATRKACESHGCPLEFILKDVSTVRYEPERLAEWARIAMQVAGG